MKAQDHRNRQEGVAAPNLYISGMATIRLLDKPPDCSQRCRAVPSAKEVHETKFANVFALQMRTKFATAFALRMRTFILLISLAGFTPWPSAAQIVDDTLFVWRGYSRSSEARFSLYSSTDKKRPRAAVLHEVATNRGTTITEDSRYLVEQIGREYGVDPAKVIWFFRWGAYSFSGANDDKKELTLRATFSRSKSGNLGLPLWRIVSLADVEEVTDRQFRRE